jgi:putative IMPACT (imprinted ancient) family translation regulator
MNSFANKLELLLKSKDVTFELGKSGFLHALKHHSSVNRAKTIIERMALK